MAAPDLTELTELADRGDVDGVLALVSVDDIVEAWCRYTARGEPRPGVRNARADDDPDWWAVSFFMARELFTRRALHRSALQSLVEHASTNWLLGCIGAGHL